ncbi:lysozyme [Acinetobacter sp. Root1280]|uniref:lysozyme n=1 Tax=Acinetobacter sp. Root1280 TaxID=1736444 RepID=UPI000700FB6B|nr:lysozyme [Acinetobacter sp. Root1280]KQX03557.1 lysozyme [Acinetobacter sp. Root1280]
MTQFWSKFFSKLFSTLFSKPLNKHHQAYSGSDIAVAVDTDAEIGFAQDQITHVSPQGVNLICGFEGLELKAYDDGVGVCTIGYGTTIYPHGKAVQYGDTCTIEQAKNYMQYDLRRFEQAVSAAVNVPLNQNQFDALVSLSYNIGIGAFKNSTLLKLLNASDYQAASHQFDVWIKAGGKTVQGLVNRRAVEKTLFLKR